MRCILGSAPPPLSGDDHEIVAVWPKQDGLEHPPLPDRLGQLVQRSFVKLHPRLLGITADPRDLDLAHAASPFPLLAFRRGGARGFAKQRLETHAEALGRALAHAASASCGKRPMSSRASRT